MPDLSKYRIFQKVVVLTFLIFAGLLAMSVIVAYGRRSHNTGLDMAKMQQMRSMQGAVEK